MLASKLTGTLVGLLPGIQRFDIVIPGSNMGREDGVFEVMPMKVIAQIRGRTGE